jgi:hypothetical protein
MTKKRETIDSPITLFFLIKKQLAPIIIKKLYARMEIFCPIFTAALGSSDAKPINPATTNRTP